MAVAVVEQPMTQLCHKLDTVKIDAYRQAGDKAEFPVGNQQWYPYYGGEVFHCNSGIASPDMIGDGCNSYCSREDYSELAYVATPTIFVPSPHGAICTGCPSPVMSAQGYIPYQMDGMHYYNQVIDYGYGNQSFCGSVPTSVQYPSQGTEGFIYGPQLYQYPVQQYYQQAPVGQYTPAAPSLPSEGMVVVEPQESAIVLTNGFSNYAGIPAVPPVPFVPCSSCENPALSVTVAYPLHHPAPTSQPLRASAPAWIDPLHELKGCVKEQKPVEVQTGSQPCAKDGIHTRNKTCTTTPSNVVLQRSNSTVTPVKAVTVTQPCSTPPMMQRVNDVKDIVRPNTDKVLRKDVTFSAIGSSCQESEVQPKVQQFIKPLTVIPVSDSGLCLPNGDRYNRDDFVTKYNDAKHFIIKSYSEENVFRSIQYGVWASTPNGNKKLDDAYYDAQRRAAGVANGCPVFLFFSVNGSRQFCGVAEMTGPVDYKRSMEFWEQHKWSGSFPLKWHFIKDVPNSQFRRIILQNNENKPVTNSRDTQEVFFQQGLEMLNIIKGYPTRTSILDEFSFCNLPINTVPDVKTQQQWCPQSFPKLGEQVVKVRNEDSDLKSPRPASTALKVCDNSAKVTHLAKQITGKGSPIAGGQEHIDKERRRVDKENIKLARKDGSLVTA